MATNTEIGARLGLAHSTVSRMRTGERVGSIRTLQRISREYNLPLEEVVDAANKALEGNNADWVRLMDGLGADAETAEPA